MEDVPDWIWEIDLDGIFTYSNSVVTDLLGYSPAEIIGQEVFWFLTPEDVPRCRSVLEEAKAERHPARNVIEHFFTATGAIRTLEISCVGVFGLLGELIGFRGISRNIPDELLPDRAAQETIERYKAAVDNSPSGIFIVQNERIVFGNPRITEVMGYTLEDAADMEVWDFVHPDDRDRIKGYYQTRMAGGTAPAQYEYKAIARSGEIRYLEARANVIHFRGAPAVLMNVVDVTDRKLAEEALRLSEEKFRTLVESISDWVWEVDTNCTYTYASPRIRDLLGYEPEEVLGKTCFGLMPPDDVECVAAEFNLIAERHEPFALLENTLVHRDGRLVYVETSGVPIFDEEGSFRGYRGIDRDVTSRKQAEDALRARTAELEAVFRAFPDIYFWLDSEMRITAYHAARHADLYAEPAVFLGRRSSEVLPSDVGPRLEEAARQSLQTDSVVATEYMLPIAGEVMFFEARSVPLPDRQVLVIIRDVTDRRCAEEALQEAETKYRSLVEESLVGVYIIQNDQFSYVNPRFARILGYTQEELTGEMVVSDIVAPEDRELVLESLRKRMSGEVKSAHYVFKGMRKDGTRVDLEVYGSRTTYQGKPTVIGTMLDITERLRAEEALQAERNFVSAILDTAGALVVVLDREGRIVRFNRACERVTGYSADEVMGRAIWDFLILPEEVDEVRATFEDLRAGHFPVQFENHWVTKDGSRHLIAWSNSVLTDAGGAVQYVIGTGIDITERRQADIALRAGEERYRLLFERSPDMVFMVRNSRITAVNPAIRKTLGYEPEEVIGLAPWDISPERQPDGMTSAQKAEMMSTLVREKGPQTFEWIYRRKDGALVDCEVSLTSYTVENETYVQAIARDITERKRAEEHRLSLERHLEAQKRQFYRETILSVTDGKLDIADAPEVRAYIAGAQLKMDVNEASEVSSARHGVERFYRERGLAGERLDSFMIGVGEAITNAIKHAGRGRVYAGASDGSVWAGVADRGTGISSLILPRATLLRGFSTKPSMGLGYSIMLDVSDHIVLKTGDRGTTVILVKQLEEPTISVSTDLLPDTWNNIPG